MSTTAKMQVLVGLALALPLMLASVIGVALWCTGKFLCRTRWLRPLQEFLCAAVLMVVSAFGAMLILLLADNFSATVFSFSVRDSRAGSRDLYAIGVAVVWLITFVWLAPKARRLAMSPKAPKSWLVMLPVALIAAGLLSMIWRADDSTTSAGGVSAAVRPNILILSSDGIRASRMSLYGAERNTTPYLSSIAADWLIFDNAYTNAADSGASIASMLTGKYPATTKLIYPPDVLRGKDAYQHLPGILKRAGYYTVDVSVRHYADPYDLNFRGAFDEANGRAPPPIQQIVRPQGRFANVFDDELFFLNSVLVRIVERYQHIYDVRDMDNAFDEVRNAEKALVSDETRNQLIDDFLERAEEPFFLNVHLMAPHGERFRPRNRLFSADIEQDRDWHLDFYDDTLLDFDDFLKKTIERLENRNLLERSLLVITSDHGIAHETDQTIPLAFRFPNVAQVGRSQAFVERLDIAPTILTAIGIDVPDWMEGRALDANSESAEIVFSTFHADAQLGAGNWFATSRSEPPFFSLGRLGALGCWGVATWTPSKDLFDGSSISPSACGGRLAAEPAEIRAAMDEHLRSRGYEF